MPSKCIVKNCNTGRKNNLEKFSMFKAPGNKETFDKWEAILRIFGSALKRCSFVCEKHFLPEEIKRVRYVRNSEGKMVEASILWLINKCLKCTYPKSFKKFDLYRHHLTLQD